jgi:hypothetical protein
MSKVAIVGSKDGKEVPIEFELLAQVSTTAHNLRNDIGTENMPPILCPEASELMLKTLVEIIERHKSDPYPNFEEIPGQPTDPKKARGSIELISEEDKKSIEFIINNGKFVEFSNTLVFLDIQSIIPMAARIFAFNMRNKTIEQIRQMCGTAQ